MSGVGTLCKPVPESK